MCHLHFISVGCESLFHRWSLFRNLSVSWRWSPIFSCLLLNDFIVLLLTSTETYIAIIVLSRLQDDISIPLLFQCNTDMIWYEKMDSLISISILTLMAVNFTPALKLHDDSTMPVLTVRASGTLLWIKQTNYFLPIKYVYQVYDRQRLSLFSLEINWNQEGNYKTSIYDVYGLDNVSLHYCLIKWGPRPDTIFVLSPYTWSYKINYDMIYFSMFCSTPILRIILAPLSIVGCACCSRVGDDEFTLNVFYFRCMISSQKRWMKYSITLYLFPFNCIISNE